jgi:DNA-binding LacI/PurR family transcriptional regulator
LHIHIQKNSGKPLFGQIVQGICKAIRQGQLRPGDQIPTEQHLAVELQVSRPTVSRSYERLRMMGVLTSTRGRGTYISDRVHDILGMTSFVPMNKIGLIVSAVGQMSQVPVPIRHVMFDTVDGVAQRVAKSNASMTFVCVGRWLDTQTISEEDAAALTRQFHEYDGLLLHCPPQLMKLLFPLIHATGRPCVSMHFQSADPRVPHVIYDREHAIELAVQRLAACGYKTIGYIGEDEKSHHDIQSKISLFRQAMAKQGLSLADKHTWLAKDFDAFDLVKTKLQTKRVALPQAFFVGTDYLAVQVLSVFKDMGIHVPDDVDLMAYDDIPALKLIRPLLSTIQVPRMAIGYQAADMLLSWPMHGSGPTSRVLQAQEIIRQTCCVVSPTFS